jgi:large subunit ribosomal protein L30
MAQEKKIKITQTKSAIGYNKKQKLTLEALGLKKVNHSVIKSETPQIQGMLKKVEHLVAVENA